jgi:putative glutamine amidotransferase
VLSHPGYIPAAWAPDGTLEAMEHPASRFRLAVQWHPEAGDDTRLFDALILACATQAPTVP